MKPVDNSLSYDYILLKGACSIYSPAIIDTDGALRWVGTAAVKFYSLAFFENSIYIAHGPLLYRNDLDGTVSLLGDYGSAGVNDFHHNVDRGKFGLLFEADTDSYLETVIMEIDAEGKLRGVDHFDPEDRPAAFAAAWRHFSSGEAGRAGPDPVTEFVVAFTRHDWDGLRRCLAEEAVVVDRRRLGFETFDREGWLTSLRALAELAPDVRSEPLRVLASNPRGRAALTRVVGTTRDGAEFENVFVSLFVAPGAQIERFERFELAELDRALARFEELTGG
jgi:hypothetical protein